MPYYILIYKYFSSKPVIETWPQVVSPPPTDLAFAYRPTMSRRGSQQTVGTIWNTGEGQALSPSITPGRALPCLDFLAPWPPGLAVVSGGGGGAPDGNAIGYVRTQVHTYLLGYCIICTGGKVPTMHGIMIVCKKPREREAKNRLGGSEVRVPTYMPWRSETLGVAPRGPRLSGWAFLGNQPLFGNRGQVGAYWLLATSSIPAPVGLFSIPHRSNVTDFLTGFSLCPEAGAHACTYVRSCGWRKRGPALRISLT